MSKTKALRFDKKFKLVILSVVVLFFGFLGAKLINSSSAATVSGTPVVGFLNYRDAAGSYGIFTSQDSIAGIGTQYVTDISPGKRLVYVLGGKLAPTSICYFIRVYNSPKSAVQVTSARVVVTTIHNARLVTLPADYRYREVCVSAGTLASPSYNVANLSRSAYVLVYQAVVHY